jgi:hypothetical protein
MSALTITLFTEPSFFQQREGVTAYRTSTKNAEQAKGFIVAFELSEENEFDLIWPFESMKPAPYEVVIMEVGTMPRVRKGSGSNESQQLVAARHLKINGQTQKPYRTAKRQTYFLVKLDQGRLRLSLAIPSGFILDPKQRTATIKLYKMAD